ncbi:16S rRNA (adenine(1518)-N(6)/adenine(1519)-N(6))-dimethyltransferase RsmA [Treponema sp.]|uniref:16S rRNA (adenine(1518)-N(6)/adenine(1519)-N(6))- dimethyltransferase RsmA n=1 Tax=Treponema sp. TaxID=166 RepID=UPI003F0FAC37
MNHPDYNSPSELKAFLEQAGMAMQKKFGQNFMINPSAREKIIELLEPQKGDLVWEIGPGLGCMTEAILASGASLVSFEIDRGFASFLHQFFSSSEKTGQFKISEGDVLKNWKGEFFGAERRPAKLFGNLPYNIAATFIADTITERAVFDRCVFTVQREVAQRMAAKRGTEQYSAFSVLCQWNYNVKPSLVLGSSSFWPRPSVSSQAVVMTKKENLFTGDSSLFPKTVHALFSARRKTVQNNIKPLLPPGISAESFLEKCGIPKNERAENLSVEDFAGISQQLSQLCQSDRIKSGCAEGGK